jgi:hypothetical protein
VIEMSAQDVRKLETLIRRSKVAQEEAKKALEKLYRKNAELISRGELSYRDSTRIMTKIFTPAHKVIDRLNLPTQLDNMARFADSRVAAPLFVIDETIRNRSWIDLLVVLKELGFSLNTLFEKPLPSVDIAGARRLVRPVSKAVDNLLYTYTPFKLRGARARDYVILLLPSIRGDSISRNWFGAEANYFYEDSIKIITPDEVRPTLVNSIGDMIFVNGEHFFRLEIDRRIAQGVYYCRMGYYISPKRTCVRRSCPLWSPCQGRRFWTGPRSFYSLAKVAPNIEVRVENYEDVETLSDFGNGMLSFEKINELSARIYIASVTFLSSRMIRNPLVRLRESIGYQVSTRAIALAIDANWLREFVNELLRKDSELYTWIYTKHFILQNLDVNDVRRLAAFFWDLIRSSRNRMTNRFKRGLESRAVDDNLVTFGCQTLLHTLSHVMHEEMIAKLQTSSGNIVYAYSRRPESDGKYRIFLFENAERGLGLSESFALRIQKEGSMFVPKITEEIIKVQLLHSRSLVSSVSLKDASENVRTIMTHLDSYNRAMQTNYGISVPVEIARYILAREDRDTARLIFREDVSAFIDDILSTSQVCWDGCYQCVRLETGCHVPPYEQMFVTSKNLLLALFNAWHSMSDELAAKPPAAPKGVKKQTILEIGQAKNLFNYIRSARSEVKITSPWISQRVAKDICDLALKKNIGFEILTSLDTTVRTHKNALKIFREAGIPKIKVRVIEDKQLHAKMVLVDESSFIIGSANLTLSGLYENVESYVVLSGTDVVSRSLAEFENLWKKATPIENFDLGRINRS